MIPYFYFSVFHLGPIPINVWGVFVSLGFAVAIWIAYARIKSQGLDPNKILDLSFWIIILAMLGARLGHVFFYEWGYYSQHLKEIIRIDQGGLSSFGGFIGAGVAFWWYGKKKLTPPDLPFKRGGNKIISPPLGGGVRGGAGFIWQYADALMFALPLGWVIGRLGCFLIHDHPGRLTNFFTGVQFPGGVRHDLGLYEVLGLLVYWVISILVFRRRANVVGFYTVSLMIFYGSFRFFLDFLRASDLSISDTRYLGLTPAQYGSVLLVVAGVYLWYNNKKIIPSNTK